MIYKLGRRWTAKLLRSGAECKHSLQLVMPEPWTPSRKNALESKSIRSMNKCKLGFHILVQPYLKHTSLLTSIVVDWMYTSETRFNLSVDCSPPSYRKHFTPWKEQVIKWVKSTVHLYEPVLQGSHDYLHGKRFIYFNTGLLYFSYAHLVVQNALHMRR